MVEDKSVYFSDSVFLIHLGSSGSWSFLVSGLRFGTSHSPRDPASWDVPEEEVSTDEEEWEGVGPATVQTFRK